MTGNIDWSRIKPLNAAAEGASQARRGTPRERVETIHLMRYAEYYWYPCILVFELFHYPGSSVRPTLLLEGYPRQKRSIWSCVRG